MEADTFRGEQVYFGWLSSIIIAMMWVTNEVLFIVKELYEINILWSIIQTK